MVVAINTGQHLSRRGVEEPQFIPAARDGRQRCARLGLVRSDNWAFPDGPALVGFAGSLADGVVAGLVEDVDLPVLGPNRGNLSVRERRDGGKVVPIAGAGWVGSRSKQDGLSPAGGRRYHLGRVGKFAFETVLLLRGKGGYVKALNGHQ